MTSVELDLETRQDLVEEYNEFNIRITPETPTLGAIVEGVNGKLPLKDEIVSILKDALMRYKVLFFQKQHLTPIEHQNFALHFAAPYVNPTKFQQEYEEEGLASVGVVPHFHADIMYRQEGPAFSFLQMHKLPPVGGDTMWVDLVSSYQELSPTMREFLEGLTAINGRRTYYWPDERLLEYHRKHSHEDLNPEQLKQLREFLAPNENPVVRVIPETGVSSYWISEEHTQRIKELSEQESQALLNMLFRHQLQPQFIYRYRWNIGDIAFWDQRTTLHSGVEDYGDGTRFGQRQSVGQNRPISVSQYAAL